MTIDPSAPSGGLALVGSRGTGKSTVGQILADRLGLRFTDSDREIEAAEGQPIRAIFVARGEPGFRAIEARVIAGLADRPASGVVATGGGSVLDEGNRRAIRRFGFVAWLAADPDTLADRLARSDNGVADRPPLTSAGTLAEIADVLAARAPLYREVADAVIETAGRTVDQVADLVLGAWSRHQHGTDRGRPR